MGEHICGHCKRAWVGTSGEIHCGAAVDDLALKEGESGRNPIWAERKYSIAGMIAIMSGTTIAGTDCENMSFNDGVKCAIWEPREGRVACDASKGETE